VLTALTTGVLTVTVHPFPQVEILSESPSAIFAAAVSERHAVMRQYDKVDMGS